MGEKLLYPPIVWSYNHFWYCEGGTIVLPEHGKQAWPVPYSCYADAMATKKVGDTIRHHISPPGYGFADYRITRMDETGIYAIKTAGFCGELTEEMVR